MEKAGRKISGAEAPTLFFDSGLGGVSVMAEAAVLLPKERFIYFADAKHAPYGQKSADEVRLRLLSLTEDFCRRGIKAMVLACNTATSAAAQALREQYPRLPVIGIEPALKPALESTSGMVRVLATTLTTREEKLLRLAEQLGREREIELKACPGLMELIEEDPSSAAVAAYLKETILQGGVPQGLVLGCTHYLFAGPLIRQLFPQLKLFDGNGGVARQLMAVLQKNELLRDNGGHKEQAAFCAPPLQTMPQIIWENSFSGEENRLYSEKCMEYFAMYRKILSDNNANLTDKKQMTTSEYLGGNNGQ